MNAYLLAAQRAGFECHMYNLHHGRVRLSSGVSVDFWPTTGRFMRVGQRSSHTGTPAGFVKYLKLQAKSGPETYWEWLGQEYLKAKTLRPVGAIRHSSP